MNFVEEIEYLISRKVEGSYWDFKLEHHENTHDLLHDIISMSNNLENRDAYIIFGIRNGSGEVVGVDPMDIHNLAYFRQHLKEKAFAGGIKPEIDFKSLGIDGNRVDILIIKNSNHTPFYLEKDYGPVKKYRIYTRVNDTNTDKGSSADINHVEQLWRKRFRLDCSKIEQMKELLKRPEDWIKHGSKFVHKNLPEFNVVLDKASRWPIRTFEYFYAYCNGRTGSMNLNYLTSLLCEIEYWAFDNNSIYAAESLKDCIRLNRREVWYYYYLKDSLPWLVTSTLLGTDENWINSYGGSPFIIFENETEKKEFEIYILDNPILADLNFDNEIPKVLERERLYGP